MICKYATRVLSRNQRVGTLCKIEHGEDLALQAHNVLRVLHRALVQLCEGGIEALRKHKSSYQ